MTPSPNTPSNLVLTGIQKSFDGVPAVHELDLAVEPGALVSLLGPSGCGKTTTLRMVAGFERPDRGRIEIGGKDVTRLAPNRRNLGMVFQHYSLFPHRTVAENISFGLRMAGVGGAQRTQEVRRMLDMVHLSGREDTYPAQLSGGQQQRVALARALVINPRVLLLDEPLGALDRSLRESMQFEIRDMQKRLGITTLLVTHDQEEAMSMSDKIAVMRHGRILQIGAPDDIYDRPHDSFVATFLGTSNLLTGAVGPDGASLSTPAGPVPLPHRMPAGQPATLSIRPERIRLGAEGDGMAMRLSGRIVAGSFRGSHAVYRVAVGDSGLELTVHRQADSATGSAALRPGEEVALGWQVADGVVLPADAQ